MFEKIMIGLVITLFFAFFLCACSSPAPEPEMETLEEKETLENLTEEARVYNENIPAPKEIVLSFAADPVQLSSGYMHLTGIVGGKQRLAAIEINGSGRIVGQGERISGYVVSSILENQLILKKEGQ